ncbi:hypothetical protein LUZ63_005162 [Rhynchospora breviuscula]|uniref:Trichome birefringence-like N-terminal domain-containing protein n=1 Tax=Rhynchospora breviuscula TaxID=2022672 RepID=A0A9Q0CMW8_9POAL|nr:hypothetical protein LUZ63_005162 [Rhynchospora breviuscula]
MTMDSPRNQNSAVGVRRTVTSILISVASLVLSLVVVSLFAFSSPSTSSQFGYLISADKLIVPRVVSGKSNNDTQKEIPNLSNEGTPSENVIQEVVIPNQTDKNEPGLNESSNEIKDPLTKNEESGSDGTLNESPLDSKEASREGELSEKYDLGTCDLYHGKWVYDEMGPLYTNNSCPVITQMQNCQGNGRPDKGYENWRWQPNKCQLPRLDPRRFLELMRGKTLAFVGDSVARNQMESLLCILWQVEAPKNRGNKRMQKWFFRSTSTSIVRIWSSWLVHHTPDPIGPAPQGIDKVFLDVPDETFMEFIPAFSVLVLSSGHWFAKKSAYVINGTVVGGQLWWPKDSGEMRVNNVEAFGISVETVLTSIANDPKFTGLAIVRSYSPDHYEGGAWNTGGSCTGKVEPVTEVVRSGFTDTMYSKQIGGFKKAAEEANGKARLKFMDITEPFGLRPDGHPGPYRSLDPNKKTKRGPNGEPPPQDCLHWCMPGPIDTWNEMLFEEIRREFETGKG